MFGLISRRRHNAELAAARAVSDRLRGERDAARVEKKAFRYAAATGAEQLCDVSIVNNHLTEDLTRSRRQRVIARKAAARIAAAYRAEKARADHLQARLDQALGLESAAVALGAGWQDRRQVHMQFDKPTVEETAS